MDAVESSPAPSAGAARRSRDAVGLLDADPTFAAVVPPGDAALARRVLHVPRLDVLAGPWSPPSRDSWAGPVSALVLLRGAIARHVAVGGRRTSHYLGPGDVLQPWPRPAEGLPSTLRFTVVEPAVLAVLDKRFGLAASRWPELTVVLTDRLAEQIDRAAAHTAISHLPRVEQRILAILWQLAERFGRSDGDGTEVRLRLTHAVIGDCVGARRPTVTLALRSLVEDGLVRRNAEGTWHLSHASRGVLRGALAGPPAAAA